ncbi:MAG: calcium/sodium antiporter [Pseudomonadales bacterium]|nr:calcium/sodium antiporter [Pseudomonadales bacterium]
MPYLLLIAGIVVLLVGGTVLVRGASGIARGFKVSPMLIGLTVVAFGTSTPELVVNITGALQGETDLAFGNAVGSNLANFGLVLGAAALLSPIYLEGQVVRREVPFLLLVTAILMVMAADGPLSGTSPLIDRGDAIILFLLFTVFVYFMVRDIIREKGDPILREAETFPATGARGGASRGRSVWHVALVLMGLALLTYGGQLTIEQGAVIAKLHSVPQVVIGIFVVAVGTSLPELVTSAIAAYNKETDLALGNIVGSNIFNSLVVLPAAGLIRPLPIPQGGTLDLAVGFGFVLVVIPLFFFSKARISRREGVALLLTYAGYLVYRVTA